MTTSPTSTSEDRKHGLGQRLYFETSARRNRVFPAAREFHEGKDRVGQLCTVAPVDPKTLEVGDIVLCRVGGSQYLHLIKAISGSRFQIGNNRGRINGWITANGVFGKVIDVAD